MRLNLLSLVFIFCSIVLSAQEKKEDVLKFSMDTKWTDEVDEDMPWNKYPRPQMKRENWTNLNGLWEYAIRPVEDKMPAEFDGKILVPFPVESALSKVKKLVNEDNYLWYRTRFETEDLNNDEKLHLNFGAIDWEAVIYINGKAVGGHKGGYTPFSLDITPYLKDGEQELIVRVWDPTDKGTQARGKQVQDPKGIWYTPVTGIWQTVWLEKTSNDHISLVKNTPDIDNNSLNVEVRTSSLSQDLKLKVEVLKDDEKISEVERTLSPATNFAGFEIDIAEPVLWSPENPFLYDLVISLETKEGEKIDEVESYFGMRKISLGKGPNGYTRIMLNNKALFQFGLLDQGWWPDGLYTAPTEEAMMYDVEMTKKMGFNMLRKHVKVEPARFYYNCDKMGMLVWQDMPNGNYFRDLRIQAWEEEDAIRPFDSSIQFETELMEMMDQFHSFPSIVVWVPFNEGWGQYDTKRVTKWVSAYDTSRLIDSPSGWTDRGVGDLVDVHLYPGPGMEMPEEDRASVLGEFGGLGLTVDGHMWWDKKNWGYLTYSDKEEYLDRFEALIKDLVGLKSFGLSGAIYTQTTDVEGEVNGLITYDREVVKINPERTRELFAPLYKEPEKFKTIVADSEEKPNHWMVAYDVKKDWYKSMNKADSWKQRQAPFSTYDNFFLPEGTSWDKNEDLYLIKEFTIDEIPESLILRYYLDKSSMEVYMNGKLLTKEKHEGGRKRHYRNQLIDNASDYLKKGKNIIAISVKGESDDRSFDLGIYTAGVKDKKEVANTAFSETNKK
ncbi:beta-galactosidase [Gramella jeungdoensis]|uniref:Beta-galactosidase n=1 Tax=Gramella jeungdoensis TaxID=708091 RepID=A0ABT0YYU6_9FLAO|nr:sugar-binding domain-containing protein [Gramella jeungdoensis]MCM8568300.1 beta-galactosidase [Gramella jeungdoensis]